MSVNVDELVDQLLADLPPATTAPKDFLREQFDRGLAWLHYPQGSGGLGLTPKDQGRAQARLAAGGAPNSGMKNPIGYGMCAPTIVAHGTDAQKQRYLRPLFTAEEIWCQLFSEPGAGSDVAGLSTKAERERGGVGHQRAKGVDHAGPHLEIRAPGGTYQSRCPKTPGHDGVPRRHGGPGGRGAPALSDHR